MNMDIEVCFLGGILFLVNVAHFQAVHWISALAYPLVLIFALTAVICHFGFSADQRPAFLVGFHVALLGRCLIAHIDRFCSSLFVYISRGIPRPVLRPLFSTYCCQ